MPSIAFFVIGRICWFVKWRQTFINFNIVLFFVYYTFFFMINLLFYRFFVTTCYIITPCIIRIIITNNLWK